MTIAAIPSPSTAVWDVFGIPIRAYALCIVAGIVVACLVTEVRLRRRGVAPWAVLDIAVWAVPFGILGARLYHVISSPQDYFGADGSPIKALYIWEGGLGIWGAVAGGAVGAWLACRQLGLPLVVVADALAPGLPLAQAVGRFGNWFNNELYGGPTTLPWGLRVHDMDRSNPGRATQIDGEPVLMPGLYHPTFLYEALWNVGVAVLVVLADRKWKFGRGRAFALYVAGYTVGRTWIELMRTDEATEFFGVRINVYTSVLVFLAALIYFVRVRGPREYVVPIDAPDRPAAEQPAAPGGVSRVDVGATDRPADATPRAYRVVGEDRFLTYQRAGYLPNGDADPDSAADGDDSADRDDPGEPHARGGVGAAATTTTDGDTAPAEASATPLRTDDR